MYKYKLYAIRFDYKEYHKIIYRKKMITPKQAEKLSGNYADRLSAKYNCSFILYGCCYADLITYKKEINIENKN